MLIPVGYEAWESFVEHKASTKGYKRSEGKVWEFNFNSYKCNGTLKFKPNQLEKKVMYIGMLTPDDGLSIDSSNGDVFIDILDKDGFVIGEFTIRNFINSRVDGRVVKLTFDGMLYDPIVIFEKMVSIRVSHTLSIDKMTLNSGERVGGWKAKASRIKYGMTYQEMVAVAGEPRTKADVDFSTRYEEKIDFFKYNYGQKWVYFKDNLVYRIR